jgi:hypothetical protein
LRSCTGSGCTATVVEQIRPRSGDADHRRQSGNGQRRQQNTTVHGRYSCVRKNPMGYSRKMAQVEGLGPI